ncbi:MAG: hypothetical protein C4K47_04415 [Candidatus Thorarchaeota archaeon]|nr:MAG: hypothetical protein C4K47_04415 [Candidatus Thorarchaeota archaeon]
MCPVPHIIDTQFANISLVHGKPKGPTSPLWSRQKTKNDMWVEGSQSVFISRKSLDSLLRREHQQSPSLTPTAIYPHIRSKGMSSAFNQNPSCSEGD